MGTPITPRIGVYGVLDETEEGSEDAGAVLTPVVSAMKACGLEAYSAATTVSDDAGAVRVAQELQSHDPDLLLAVIICWSFDHLTLSILRRLPRPLAILAVPGIRSGSLVGAHQLGSLLTDLGADHAVFYGDPNVPGTYTPLVSYARAAAAKRRLELGRLGHVGHRTPGMTPIAFDEVEINRLLGSQVVNYGWEEVEARARALSESAIAGTVQQLSSLGASRSAPEDLHDAARLYLALRGQAEEDDLLALALGCYPRYAGRVCVPAALLTENGVPAGCEGDVNSTLAMYLLQSFTGRPAHFGEILEVDERENTIVTSHCGCSAPSLAADGWPIEIAPVRLWNRGTCLRFPCRTGPATYANLVGRRGTYRLCALEGEVLPTEMVFEGNPGRFRPSLPVRTLLDVIGEEGFGHHWMMGYGHAVPELKAFCRLLGIRGVFP